MPERATAGPGDAHAAPERSRSPAATEATLAGRVLELQQSHGNAAVARMIEASRGGVVLAREPTDAGVPPVAGVPIAEPRAGDAADMDRAIGEYLSINDFPNAARILNGFNQADIDSRIKGYTVQQRNGLFNAADGNGSAAVRIRGADRPRPGDRGPQLGGQRLVSSMPIRRIATRVPGQLRGMGWREDVHLLAAGDSAHLAIAGQMRSRRRRTFGRHLRRPAGGDGRLELVRRRGDAQRAQRSRLGRGA